MKAQLYSESVERKRLEKETAFLNGFLIGMIVTLVVVLLTLYA